MYAASAVSPVAENLGQSAKLLDFAAAAADTAQAAIDGARPSEAAIAVRTARASVGQAASLLTAIDDLGANLADATTKLTAAVTDTEQDACYLAGKAPEPADIDREPALQSQQLGLTSRF